MSRKAVCKPSKGRNRELGPVLTLKLFDKAASGQRAVSRERSTRAAISCVSAGEGA